ncbi:hypothetical protein SAMN05216351_11631 [Pseudobutyrivibrio sp. JW11]|uniref:hypothetical protein n=1 Tax=Pseudobutyrivibrio sp. JW11 TaxID=1855302 RepID=UPI0008E1A2B0|nr:hypothetical protein [Pseudobutyrivibrio sp. JW11]SFO56628.1 hypothetical protein SAMN05216351_11631 [Pseudobutyrivibrio sp. JW11]
MVKKNKGLLKKIGCILISASILLTGWTFFGSSISIADGDTTIVDEVLNEDPDTTEEDVEEVAETEETEESEDAADASDETTTTFSTDSLELYSLPADTLGTSLASTNDDGTYTADDGATYSDSSMTVLVKVPASVGSTFSVPSSVSTIKSGAFDGSNVTDLTFASDATIGTHSSWPANGTVVHAEALSSTSEVVTYFEKLIKAGRNVKILFDESSTTTYSITFEYYKDSISTANKIGTETEEYDEDDDLELPDTIKTFNSVSYNYVSGPTPDFETVTADATYSFIYTEATTYDITYNYVLQDSTGAETGTTKTEIVKVVEGETPSMPATTKTFDGTTYTYVSGPTPTFAAATANAEYSFVYKASSSSGGESGGGGSTTPTYTVTIKGNFYENDGTTYIGERTITSYTQEAGKVITAPTVDGYTAFGTTTYTVTASNSQTATFTYKKSTASSSSTKKFKVTVYDVFYDQTMTKKIETKTRQTDTYSQGDTFSYDPKTYSGYEYVSAENQSGTVNADRTVTFKYKATTASGKTTSNSKYSVTAGANQKVPSNVGTVTITCDGPLDKIVAIKVDGVTLAQNQFTVESGSTILTLTASYVSSLSAGDHVVRFEYTDGWAETLLTITGKTTTTVTYKVSSDGSISSGHTKDTTPTTADGFDSRYLLCLAIFLLGAGTILFSKQKKLEAILAGDRDDE